MNREGVHPALFYAVVVFASLLCMMSITRPIQGQEVVDTITVEVNGVPAALNVVGPLRGYVGDTLTFLYEILDDEGAPTVGVTLWEVADTTRARITSVVPGEIQVELLRAGRLELIAYVDRLDRLALGGTYGPGTGADEGRFQWAADGPFNIPVGAIVYFCGVGYSGDRPLFASGSGCADAAVAGIEPRGLPSLQLAMLRTIYRRRIVMVENADWFGVSVPDWAAT